MENKDDDDETDTFHRGEKGDNDMINLIICDSTMIHLQVFLIINR